MSQKKMTTKEKNSARYREWYNSNLEKDPENFKFLQSLARWKNRNKAKPITEYKPRSADAKRRLEVYIENMTGKKKVDKVEADNDDIVEQLKKPIKTVVEKQYIDDRTIKNRENLLNQLLKVNVQRDKTKAIKTVTANLDRVKNIYKLLFNKEWDYKSFTWLEDVDRIYEAVDNNPKWKAQKSKSNQYISIAGILKYFPRDKWYKLYKTYSSLGSQIVDKIEKVSKENRLTTAQKRDWLRWPEVEKIWYELRDDNGGNTFLRALYGIYTFIPPRRIDDYRLMKIVRKDKIKKNHKFERKYNYIFIDKHRKPLSMTIWNYKEAPRRKFAIKNKNYGQYESNLPEKLAIVLQQYINDENLNAGDFLFGLDSNHSKHYNNAFSGLVSKNLFDTFANTHMTVNALRHSYVSWTLDKLKTLNQQEELAFQMATSVNEMRKTYYKIELTPDYTPELPSNLPPED
jgi:hypothetical protein